VVIQRRGKPVARRPRFAPARSGDTARVSDLPLTGGCLCGAVRYELSAPPVAAGYCHCTRCQRRTGTAAAPSALVAPGSLSVVAGAEHIREWHPDRGWSKAFCTRCGGALWSRNPDAPDEYGVRMGTFDRDPGIRPAYRQHLASAVAWEPVPDDGLARFEGPRPEA
jgi:hypothetical protein